MSPSFADRFSLLFLTLLLLFELVIYFEVALRAQCRLVLVIDWRWCSIVYFVLIWVKHCLIFIGVDTLDILTL